MDAQPKVKGIVVEIGERKLVVPPLNFRSLQVLQPKLQGYKGNVDPDSLGLVMEVAMAALKRNYDDVTLDFLLDHLDVANMEEFMEAAMDVSGLKRKAIEQAGRSAADPSTGTSSMPS